MALTRMCYLSRLRPEGVQAYKDYHAKVWPELLALYREAGFRGIHCFLDGCDLAVIGEYDAEIYAAKREWVAAHPVEQRWSALMQSLMEPGVPTRTLPPVFSVDLTAS